MPKFQLNDPVRIVQKVHHPVYFWIDSMDGMVGHTGKVIEIREEGGVSAYLVEIPRFPAVWFHPAALSLETRNENAQV